MNAPDIVETRRLRGERLASRHWDLWLRMGTDPRLMATLGGVWTEAQAREKLEWNMRQWEQNGHGQWLFFLKDGECLIGRCGVRKMVVNAKEEVELGYAVMPEFWGQGFATEMGAKALQVAFEVLRYPNVVAFTILDNSPSERVMQKLGFGFEEHIVHAGHPHVLYRLQNPRRSHQVTSQKRHA